LQLQLITAQINYLHVEISSVKINHFSWQTPVEYTIIPGRSSDCLLDSIYRLICIIYIVNTYMSALGTSSRYWLLLSGHRMLTVLQIKSKW